jgi:hypothetical protein
VVLPTPLGPQNKNACASWWFFMAFFKVVVMCSCPTTVSKVWGLYFRAETINFSITRLQAKTIWLFSVRQISTLFMQDQGLKRPDKRLIWANGSGLNSKTDVA